MLTLNDRTLEGASSLSAHLNNNIIEDTTFSFTTTLCSNLPHKNYCYLHLQVIKALSVRVYIKSLKRVNL